MHRNAALVRLVRACGCRLTLWASGLSLVGSEANITRTNWFDRWITNVIEVRMPANRFVNEYHTNWVTLLRTNVVDVYATNRVTRTLTNQVAVEASRTNLSGLSDQLELRSLTNCGCAANGPMWWWPVRLTGHSDVDQPCFRGCSADQLRGPVSHKLEGGQPDQLGNGGAGCRPTGSLNQLLTSSESTCPSGRWPPRLPPTS